MPHSKTLLIASLLCLLLASACSTAGQNNEPTPDSLGGVIPVVEAVPARLGTLPVSERLNGNVIAQNQVVLFPEISGKVVQVEAYDGEKVRRGQPLVYLDDTQYKEQIQQAEARYRVNQAALKQAHARHRELEALYNRSVRLAEEGLTSQIEVETLGAQLAAAKASIELAEAEIQQALSAIKETKVILAQTIVRAPISGTIGRRNVEVGMQVSPTTELFTIGDLSRVRVEVVITERNLAEIRVGQPARIYVRSRGTEPRVLDAKVSRISPFLDSATRSTEAEIDVENKGNVLLPGMSVTAEILHGESEKVTLVPSSAIYTHPDTGQTGIYVLSAFEPETGVSGTGDLQDDPPDLSEPEKVVFRPVRIMAEGRMETGVEGIQPNQWVVTVGQDLLAGREEARVRVSTWDRVLSLQELQREDLLYELLERGSR